jgi:hypothetical protein
MPIYLYMCIYSKVFDRMLRERKGEHTGGYLATICHESKTAGRLLSCLTCFFSAKNFLSLSVSLRIRDFWGKKSGRVFLCVCGKVSLDGIFCIPPCICCIYSFY